MKIRRVMLVGCARGKNSYCNAKGYSDPTAGSAMAGSRSIYAAPLTRRPGEKERIIRRKIHPVSEMEKDLAALGL